MTTYLNKEKLVAVLFNLTMCERPRSVKEVLEEIEKGSFDATRDVGIEYQGKIHTILSLRKELVEKDKRIKELENKNGDSDLHIHRLLEAKDAMIARLLNQESKVTLHDPVKVLLDIGDLKKQVKELQNTFCNCPVNDIGNLNTRMDTFEKFQKRIELQMQACLKDLNGGMQPGDSISLDSRVKAIEQDYQVIRTRLNKLIDQHRNKTPDDCKKCWYKRHYHD